MNLLLCLHFISSWIEFWFVHKILLIIIIIIIITILRLYSPLRSWAYQPTAGLTSTRLQFEVKANTAQWWRLFSTLSSPVVTRYKSVATQIPYNADLTPIDPARDRTWDRSVQGGDSASAPLWRKKIMPKMKITLAWTMCHLLLW